jgi:Translation initiation factor 3 (IF-3)
VTLALKDKKENLPDINDRIRALQLQVIDVDGENLGVISRKEALRIALEKELDLVLLSETGPEGAPIAKIMDFGKIIYERKRSR